MGDCTEKPSVQKSPYCPKCTHKRCGKHHVYVIELDPTVLCVKKFRRENPQAFADSPCYYVGSTRHACDCRLGQHQSFSMGEDSYICRCGGKPKEIKFLHAGGKTRGNKMTGTYAKCLRPDLFYHINPLSSKKKAEETEHDLAEYLKKQGAAVHQR